MRKWKNTDEPALADLENFKVAIDFDGCMVHHPGGNTVEDYGKPLVPVPGAIEWCHKFMELDIKIILWTSRGTQSFLQEAVDYMIQNKIIMFGINDNPEQKQWSDSKKAHAHVYVDDNGLIPLCYPIERLRGVVDWEVVGPLVLIRFFNRKKYYF